MTNDVLSIQMEELVLTLQTLIEHQQEQLADSQTQGKSNEEFAKQIIEMIKPLSSLLKTYQAKEQLLTENTNQAIKNNIAAAFEQNKESYRARINQGFTTHIDTATKTLSTVAANVEQQFKDLETAATKSKTEFKSRQDYFELYENTYDEQSKKLKASVDTATTEVIQDTKAKLDVISTDFTQKLAKDLSWKVAGIFGVICILIMVSTLGLAWLLVPSKADIAERQGQYRALEKGMLLDNLVLSDDGYYGEVDTTKCKNDLRPSFWGNSTWCKFK